MPSEVVVVWDPAGDEILGNLTAVSLEKAGRIVLAAMKRTIPRSRDGSNGRPAGYAASRLRILERGRELNGQYVDVGTDATTPSGQSYPAILEHGTKPHLITSHGNYPLRDRHGRVLGRVVHHPGTRPMPWARTALAVLSGARL